MAEGRFTYACAKCGGEVTKPPVVNRTVGKSKDFHGLHGWTCSKCGPTKVKRNLA